MSVSESDSWASKPNSRGFPVFDASNTSFATLGGEWVSDHQFSPTLTSFQHLMNWSKILAEPVRTKVCHHVANSRYRASVSSMQGYRKTMEDSHRIVLSLPNHPNIAFFSIFDGHNGNEAANYLSEHLPSRIDGLSNIHDDGAVIETIVRMDKNFITTAMGTRGSTIVFALVEPLDDFEKYSVRVFWVGDSRCFGGRFTADVDDKLTRDTIECVETQTQATLPTLYTKLHIGKGFEVTCLTRDHVPSEPSERLRILASGNSLDVRHGSGYLSVSRSFGDAGFKMNCGISCVCETSTYVCERGSCLFLACDGFFEKMDSHQVLLCLYNEIEASKERAPSDGHHMCSALSNVMDACLESGSKDNMTGMFVLFNGNERASDDVTTNNPIDTHPADVGGAPEERIVSDDDGEIGPEPPRKKRRIAVDPAQDSKSRC